MTAQMPRRYSVEEYGQLLRKNNSKTFYSHWDLFDFVFGNKKATIIRNKFNASYNETSRVEIAIEHAKIKEAIDIRVKNGWLNYIN